MNYSMHLCLLMTSLLGTPGRRHDEAEPSADGQSALRELLQGSLDQLLELAQQFRSQPVSPAATHQFELQLQERLRELGRQLSQHTYNHLEPDDPNSLAKHLKGDAGPYTRLNRKTPQNAWTLFGQIRLWRVGYRPTHKGSDPTIFPLAIALGLSGPFGKYV